MNIRICLLSSALMLLPHADATAASTSSSYSDDTELFIYDFAKAGDFRPKVLFVFDNSGSMANTTTLAKEAADLYSDSRSSIPNSATAAAKRKFILERLLRRLKPLEEIF